MNFLRKHNVRHWSNDELRLVASHLTRYTSMINVSGWKDEDKEGGHYRDYFPNATHYVVSNYGGDISRGTQSSADLSIDLDRSLPPDMVNKFDIAFSHTVLEHVQDPVFSFKQIAALAREVVITVVPFKQHLHFDSGCYGDYYRFTPFAMRKMYEESGLTVIYESHTPFPAMDVYLCYVGVRNPENFDQFQKHLYDLSAMSGEIGKTRWYGYFEHFAALFLNKILRK